ncbi:MAG: TlpA family protein disulfide reductase [Bacteroidota bacterium]|nr:TlpA family protein disulfide reductase [Bacteroidota bacterium]
MAGGKHDNPVDFTLVDTSGKEVQLSDYRGKFVHIDMWASWCGPCLAALPEVKEAQQELKDVEIVWMFVSFDKDIKTWKKFLKEKGLPGVHLFAKNEEGDRVKDLFRIKGIPYYVWIDKEGKIAMLNAPSPNSKVQGQLRQFAAE